MKYSRWALLAAIIAVPLPLLAIEAEREIQLSGDLLIMPLADRNQTIQHPIPGAVKLLVDGKPFIEAKGQLQPMLVNDRVDAPRGKTIPAMIEVFHDRKLVDRFVYSQPLPQRPELPASKPMEISFESYGEQNVLLHRFTGTVQVNGGFMNRLKMLGARFRPNAKDFIVVYTGVKDTANVETMLVLEGDLNFQEVSDVPEAAKPVGDGGQIEVFVGDTLVHRVFCVHPRKLKDARFWGYLDMKEYKGKKAVIKYEDRKNIIMSPERAQQILDRFESSDKIRHIQPVYKEEGRPQFHFSQMQGWNNDPNGMFYSDGLWHISWQCNPLEVYFGGWYWGHAVSEDLIHWQEAPRVLRSRGGDNEDRYPGMANSNCFSGGACVDINNTLGLQTSDQKTIIATFTDNPWGEVLAYSTDGGFRYTVMNNSEPVIVQPMPEGAQGRGSWGRDPKPFWHAPSQKWIIVTYRMGTVPGMCSGHMAFYSSKDLKNWKLESMTEKLFPHEFTDPTDNRDPLKKDFHECPEFVELPVAGNPNNTRWVLFDASPKYQIGTFDGSKFTSDEKEYRWTIFGRMKAGQCFSNAPDGRAVLMIWARIPYGKKVPFASGFTLPLELSLRTADDGIRLYANPVKELLALREEEIFSATDKPIGGEEVLSFETQEKLLEVILSVKPKGNSGRIELTFGGDNKVVYHLKEKLLGMQDLASNERERAHVHDKDDGQVDLRLYIDRASCEVFAENGSVYRIDALREVNKPLGSFNVALRDGQGTVENMKVYKLKSIWPERADSQRYPQEAP